MIGILSCFVKTVQYVQRLLSWASYPSLTWSIRLHSFEWRQDAGVDFHNRVQFRPQDFLLTPSHFSELLFSATIFYFVYQAIFVWMVTKCILIFDIQVQFRKYVFVFSLFFKTDVLVNYFPFCLSSSILSQDDVKEFRKMGSNFEYSDSVFPQISFLHDFL